MDIEQLLPQASVPERVSFVRQVLASIDQGT
jgi:hypothetical protein